MGIKSVDWKIFTIDALKASSNNAIAIGPFGSRMKSDCYVSSGVPVIRGNNISNTKSFTSEFVFITEQKANELYSSNVVENDLVSPHRGAIGEVGIVPRNDGKKFVISSSLMKLTCNQSLVVPLFLFYFFRTPQGKYELLKNASTVGTPGIATPLTSLKSITVPLPPLSEQKAIAHILGTLDDKIELNQQINETLEAMARAIFKSWFVDFDPVRAKMEGRQPAGMDATTADLFPDEFEESSLGLIPKGWKVGTLGEEIEIIKGKSYKSSELVPSSTALVTLKSFHRGGGYRPDGLKPYNGTYKPEQIIKPGELVVAYTDVTQAADVIGKPAIVKPDERYNTLVASLDLGIIRVRNKNLNTPFLYYLFNQNDFQNHVYSHTNGSTVLHLSKDGIPSYEFCSPHSSLISNFGKIISPIFEKSNINWQESQLCTTLVKEFNRQ